MKKYINYIIIFFLIIYLIIFKGIQTGTLVNSHLASNPDEFSVDSYLFTYNLIAVLLIFVLSLFITFRKNNEVKFKAFIMIAITLALLFVPVGIKHYSGGFTGIMNETHYVPLIMIGSIL